MTGWRAAARYEEVRMRRQAVRSATRAWVQRGSDTLEESEDDAVTEGGGCALEEGCGGAAWVEGSGGVLEEVEDGLARSATLARSSD